MAGPLVRSSYRAGRLFARALAARGEKLPEHLSALGEDVSTNQEASSLLERYGASKDSEVAPAR